MSQVSQLIKLTKKYLTKYDYENVIKTCNEILEIDPESYFANDFRLISLYQTGHYEEAIEGYEKLDKMGHNDYIIDTLAILYEKVGKYDKALEYRKNNRTTNKKFFLQRDLIKMKKYSPCIDYCNKKLKFLETIENTDTTTKRKIALLEEKAAFLYLSDEYEESLDCFKQAITLYESVKDKICENCEETDRWYSMLNEYLTEYEPDKFFKKLFDIEENYDIWEYKIQHPLIQFQNSLLYCEVLLKLHPDNPKILTLAAGEAKLFDERTAREYYKKLLETEPENTDIIFKLLDSYSGYYSKDKQLKLIDEKLYIEKIKFKLLKRKIRLLESMTLYDEAISVYDEYLSADKEDGQVTSHLTVFDKIRCMEEKAINLYLENDYEEAFSVYKEVSSAYNNALKLDDVYQGDCYPKEWYDNILSESLNKSNNYSLFFEEFFNLNSKSIKLWIDKINYIMDWRISGNPITYINILLAKNPENIRLLITKAHIYSRTARIHSADKLYRKILKTDPDNNEAKNQYFNILVRLAKYKKAYHLLKSMQIDYNEISYYLRKLADYLRDKYDNDEAYYCYRIIYENRKDMKIIDNIKVLLNRRKGISRPENCKYFYKWIDSIKYRHERKICPECGGKLIPIKYGYWKSILDDEEFMPGGCIVTDDCPTNYCKKCEKQINLGVYGIEISMQDHSLYSYARSKIIWLTGYVEKNPETTVVQLRRVAKKIGLDKDEFNMFLDKLEKIGHIHIEKNKIKMAENYNEFDTLFI